jgi:hypothetical protein
VTPIVDEGPDPSHLLPHLYGEDNAVSAFHPLCRFQGTFLIVDRAGFLRLFLSVFIILYSILGVSSLYPLIFLNPIFYLLFRPSFNNCTAKEGCFSPNLLIGHAGLSRRSRPVSSLATPLWRRQRSLRFSSFLSLPGDILGSRWRGVSSSVLVSVHILYSVLGVSSLYLLLAFDPVFDFLFGPSSDNYAVKKWCFSPHPVIGHAGLL